MSGAWDVMELGARAWQFFSVAYLFSLDATLAAMLVGAVSGVVGTFVVLRGWSLVGDATGHATLPGLGLAFLLFGAGSASLLMLGAAISALAAALLTGLLSEGRQARPDAAIGVVLSVFFGLGVLILSYVQGEPSGAQAGLGAFLFGNAAAVTRGQLALLALSIGLVSGLTALFYRPLALAVFDRAYARATGVPVRWVDAGLLAAVALCVVVSIQATGAILVSAMLIIPASTGRFLVARLQSLVWVSAVLGASAGAVGAFLSFVLDGVATGPAMVLVAAALFALALVFGPRGGLWRAGKRGVRQEEVARA